MNLIGIISISSLLLICSCGFNENNQLQDNPLLAEDIPPPIDTVIFAHWQKDPFVNQYIQVDLKNNLLAQKNIYLKSVSIDSILNSNIKRWDIAWVNGLNYITLKSEYGFNTNLCSQLRNFNQVDMRNPFVAFDYQRPIKGDQCPWGQVQFQWIYNANYIDKLPNHLTDFLLFLKKNPGKFTIPNDFTGVSLIKQMLIDIMDSQGVDYLTINKDELQKHLAQLMEDLYEFKPYMWRSGTEFPKDISEIHDLFAKGELWFTFSYNANEIYNKKSWGLFPSQSKKCFIGSNVLSNTHYLVVNKNSTKEQAAIDVIDYCISYDAQYQKQRVNVWGDNHVLDIKQLSRKQRFQLLALCKEQESFTMNKISKIQEPPLFWEQEIQKQLFRFVNNTSNKAN